MRAFRMALVLIALAQGSAIACDETCAPGFVFDDVQATCVRSATS